MGQVELFQFLQREDVSIFPLIAEKYSPSPQTVQKFGVSHLSLMLILPMRRKAYFSQLMARVRYIELTPKEKSCTGTKCGKTLSP